MSGRIHLPKELERAVKTEAGHRCAIPTCKQYPVEVAHIEPYSNVRKHEFDNLIALCPTDHTRFDNGDIDKKSMLIYKSNLGVINSRYTEMELTLLESLKKNEKLPVPGTMTWLFQRLESEGLIKVVGKSGISMSGIQAHWLVSLTKSGESLVNHWLNGKPVDESI